VPRHKALAYKVVGGQHTTISNIHPATTKGISRDEASERFVELDRELRVLQDLLYGARTHAVLVVLQGMDTSGKDGTIAHVMASVNPSGCRVEAFKVPTEAEKAHDFLWRVHRVVPPKGFLTIFNRSHYEDVLVARVHELVPENVWKRRYAQINQFEALLASEGTIIVKFYLHMSPEEQRRRLLERERESNKAWKLSLDDWSERRYWDAYIAAYEAVLRHCCTAHAPWWIIPADQKWYRNLAVAQTLVEALRPYKQAWTDRLELMANEALRGIHQARAQGILEAAQP
jgi:PPK2 family polyphosphate:nucleotide phosphotransferase